MECFPCVYLRKMAGPATPALAWANTPRTMWGSLSPWSLLSGFGAKGSAGDKGPRCRQRLCEHPPWGWVGMCGKAGRLDQGRIDVVPRVRASWDPFYNCKPQVFLAEASRGQWNDLRQTPFMEISSRNICRVFICPRPSVYGEVSWNGNR